MYKININEKEFNCEHNEDLLKALRKTLDDSIPFGCRMGGCGMCKIEVVEGDYKLGTSSMAALSLEEREKRYTLACKTYPLSDMKIRIENK